MSATGGDVTRCVHCRCLLTDATRDHVFPASWYPATTPPTIQRWTVPSCTKCNGEFGKMEQELFIRLALCVDPKKAEAAGLSAKAVRSMGIGAEGISLKERLHRKALKRKILAATERYKPGTETFPGLGPHPGFTEHEQIAIRIPATLLEGVSKKVVRGCEYILGNKRIVDEHNRLTVYFLHAGKVPGAIVQIFEGPAAQTTHLGPGFTVTRASAHDEPGSVIYRITVWGAVVIYAAILPQEPARSEEARPASSNLAFRG